MSRSAWVLLFAAFAAASALVWWQTMMPPTLGPVATTTVPAPLALPEAKDASDTASTTSPPSSVPTPEPEKKRDAPSFDVVRVAPSGSAVIAGRAAPGVEVTIKDGEKEIGRAVADARGEWVVLPDEKLGPGAHALVVETPTGERSDDVAVLVPEKKTKPGEARPGEKTEEAIAVLLPKDAPARPLKGSPVAPPGTLALDAVEYDARGEVVVGGQAKPGAEIHVFLGGARLGTATADENGRWETKPAKAINPGLYTLRADEMSPDGRVVARVSVPFRRVVVAAGGPGDQIVVQPGDNLWNIARQTYGSGPRYTVIYAANETEIRDPDLIYPGQVFKLPAN